MPTARPDPAAPAGAHAAPARTHAAPAGTTAAPDVPVGDEGPGGLALHAAAFGAGPRAEGPGGAGVLPPAAAPRTLWWRAVAHAGQGHYARAGADLAALRRADPDGPWGSLAASTAASLIRQMGGHAEAAVHDGRALAAVGMPGPADGMPAAADSAPGPLVMHARCDALTGLAADRLGRGDHAGARVLLDRCARVLAQAPGGTDGHPRLALRLRWVTAETAMTAGDAQTASRAARAGLALAESGVFGSVRHGVKTLLVAAAAEAVGGDAAASARLAGRARAEAEAAGLLPLRWAACLLLAGVAGGAEADGARAEEAACAAELRSRGGGDPRLMRGYR